MDPKDSTIGRVELDKTTLESANLHQMWNPPQMAALQEAIETRKLPVHDDITLAKLRPGQVIELEVHGRRGYGRDHAKYSPVAKASYRLMPRVELVKPVYGKKAEELVGLYEPGLFRLEPCEPEDIQEGRHERGSRRWYTIHMHAR